MSVRNTIMPAVSHGIAPIMFRSRIGASTAGSPLAASGTAAGAAGAMLRWGNALGGTALEMRGAAPRRPKVCVVIHSSAVLALRTLGRVRWRTISGPPESAFRLRRMVSNPLRRTGNFSRICERSRSAADLKFPHQHE